MMTQERIESIREYIIDAQCRNEDFHQYGKTALENLSELAKQLAAMTAERDALVTWKQTLAADIAERDDTIIALKSKLDAVPVEGIRRAADYFMVNGYYGDVIEAIEAWLKTVQP